MATPPAVIDLPSCLATPPAVIDLIVGCSALMSVDRSVTFVKKIGGSNLFKENLHAKIRVNLT